MTARKSHIPAILSTFILALVAIICSCQPAYAADTTTPSNDPYTTNPDTYVYLSCPIEIYRSNANGDYQAAEQLLDDFEEFPEHWLYVLTPLAADEAYHVTLDLSCRLENAPLKDAKVSATYSSYLPDGALGSVRIEVTEQIAPHTFLVYYGEIKYISDGDLCLNQDGYGGLLDHHLFYFSLRSASLPQNTQPLSEQRAFQLSDSAARLEVTITGDAQRIGSVYDENLLESDYMYPYRKYHITSINFPALNPISLTDLSTSLNLTDAKLCRLNI